MTLGNEFWAAIIGSFVGGTIAGVIQLMTIRHENSKEEKRELDRKKALGRSLTFKLMRISTDLYRINEHLDDSKIDAEPDMLKEPWSYVRSISNLFEPVKILPEEVALFMGKQNDEIVNNLLDLGYIHRSALLIMQKYGTLRDNFAREVPNVNFNGETGNIAFTKEEYTRLRPDMIVLNSMIESIHSRSQADFDISWKTLEDANRFLTTEIGLKLKLKRSRSEENEE